MKTLFSTLCSLVITFSDAAATAESYMELPKFMCWSTNEAGENVALFSEPLFLQDDPYVQAHETGFYAYPESYVDEAGYPGLYQVEKGSYEDIFENHKGRSLQDTLDGFTSPHDKATVGATIKAFEDREQSCNFI